MFDIKFNITFVTFFNEKVKFEYDVERYDDNVIFCLKKGSFSYGFDEENPNKFTAKAGDVVLCKKREYFFRSVIEPVSMCMIKFKSDDSVFKRDTPIAVKDFSRYEYNMKMLECIHFISDPTAGLATEHYCRDIVYQVADAIAEGKRPLNNSYMYINTHLSERISVEDMARSENFSVVHFINTFKEVYGKSPKQYITDLRMKKAAHLLINTELQISEISYMCGYNDSLYFSRHFKKYFNKSPKIFRSSLHTEKQTNP